MFDKHRLKTVTVMCFICALGAVIIFLPVIAGLGFDISNIGITFPAFIAMAAAMCTVMMRMNFSKESMIRKIVAQTVMTLFTMAIMYGVYGLVYYVFLV